MIAEGRLGVTTLVPSPAPTRNGAASRGRRRSPRSSEHQRTPRGSGSYWRGRHHSCSTPAAFRSYRHPNGPLGSQPQPRRGASGIQEFLLDKVGNSSPWDMQFPLEPGDKAKLSVPFITEAHAGTYYCHCKNSTNWSEHSNALELVVTGLYRKPSLIALSSPVLTSGETVELQCASFQGFDRFILTQEGDPETPRTFDSKQLAFGETQTVFTVGPVTPDRRWSFQCYGHFAQTPQEWSHPSDLLQLLVSGASRRPSLLSLQGTIVTLGQNVTLRCRSEVSYDTFALTKEGRQDVPQRPGHHPQTRLSQADFSLGPISGSHGGQYRCFGGQGLTPQWSEPSDPLDILVAGQIRSTPTLSVQPGPSVNPGENVTFLCVSGGKRDTFLLAKEGATGPPLSFKVDKRENITEAKFSLGPVTSAHGGTYRCYSYSSRVPYRLSHPSAPLQLQVSGPSEDSRNPTSVPTSDVLLKFRKMAQGTATGNGWLRSRQDEDPHGATYAQVKHTGLRQGVASSPPVSGAQGKAQDGQTKENTQADRQVPAPDVPLEVTYAQLEHLDTAQKTTASTSFLSRKPPAEPTMYASLAFH
ncbi:leukocyte immunoglobulin-like receptor subfamily A member 6 [Suncus etruscus]|uniref:leukocyte immunoglobulin-like receptor subfamily A member 6 n=1 Tax=Suncus etruscus TaxID=109475 RepID=UPI002110B2AB|nr:leukocyte immunoglobulin-like receptor subfamily A member 6 [Suncus etruscus]